MQEKIMIRVAFLACAMAFGAGAKTADSTCPGGIDSALCEKMKVLSDTDRVICKIYLNVTAQWAHQDGGCDKTNPACTSTVDTSWKGPWRDSILDATRLLFENYDLRWPDDPQTRASIPAWEGRMDTITGWPHALYHSYVISATKLSLFSIVKEPYILGVLNWVESIPSTSLPRRREYLTRMPERASLFNLNGQKVGERRSPVFKVRMGPAGH